MSPIERCCHMFTDALYILLMQLDVFQTRFISNFVLLTNFFVCGITEAYMLLSMYTTVTGGF